MEFLAEKRPIASFDFDNTLVTHELEPRPTILDLVFEYKNKGYQIVIVTARAPQERDTVDGVINAYDLPIENVYFTNRELKGSVLQQIGVSVHIDDDPDQLQDARQHGIRAIDTLALLAKHDLKYQSLKGHLPKFV